MPALRIRRGCAVATVFAMGIGLSNAGMIAIGVLGAWTGPAQAAGPVVFSPPDDRDTRAVAAQLDNDLFSGSARDRDYSWGLSATFAQSLKTDAFGDARVAATQYGLIAMTPTNIASKDPDTTDKPYASLLYVTRGWLDVEGSRAVYNGVTIGLLGLGLAESLQSGLHAAIGGDDPRGWHHQISNGGELTGRWLRSDQWLLNCGLPRASSRHPADC